MINLLILNFNKIVTNLNKGFSYKEKKMKWHKSYNVGFKKNNTKDKREIYNHLRYFRIIFF